MKLKCGNSNNRVIRVYRLTRVAFFMFSSHGPFYTHILPSKVGNNISAYAYMYIKARETRTRNGP